MEDLAFLIQALERLVRDGIIKEEALKELTTNALREMGLLKG